MADTIAKFIDAFSSFKPHASEEELKKLYESIEEKNSIDTLIKKYGESSKQKFDQPNLASFKYSVPANLRVMATFETYVELHVPALGLVYSGKGGGLLVGLGVSGGTLYYNDQKDLSGKSDFNANFLSAYANCNLIRGGVYATYQGGGIPMIGVSGGSGKWSG